MSVQSEVRDLRLLVALGETGSLNAAARQLHLTPSALSQQLRELERRLGGPLFLRQWRRLVPTPAAQRFTERARAILHELEQLEAETRQLLAGALGSIRVATACQHSYSWLPRLLGHYAALEPAIEVSLIAEAAEKPYEWLLERKLDVALVVGDKPPDKRLKAYRLFRDELVAIVSREHPWAARRRLDASDFAAAHLFTDPGGLGRRSPFGRMLADASVAPRKTTLVPMAGGVALELVREGLGVTVTPHWTVAPLLKSAGLTSLRIGSRGLWLDWSVVTRQEQLDRPLRSFLAALQREHPQARPRRSAS
jgi:LysR family transcriptional regulator, regulator for metE and metH